MKHMRPVLQSSTLIFASLLVALLIFETFCRLVVDDGMHYHLEMWKYAVALKESDENRDIGHRHVPNSFAHLMGVDVQINADGMRDDDIDQSRYTRRVLMLGDSVTFGWGVPHVNTVSSRLENLLAENSDKRIDVLNAGVGNYNTAMEVAWFEKSGLAYNPDFVVLNVFVNDAEPTPTYSDVSWIDRHLYSRVILFGASDTVARTVLGRTDWKSYYSRLYDDAAPGWVAMQDSIRILARLCETQNIPLMIVDYPELRELAPYPFTSVSEKIRTLAEEVSADYISLLPAVQDKEPNTLWVTIPDPHPNAFAAGLFTEYLAPHISRNLAH